jgi:hypothetical protein
MGFAREYPVLAFMGGLAAGAAGSYYLADTIKKRGVLAVDAGVIRGKLNLDTMDWELVLTFTFRR